MKTTKLVTLGLIGLSVAALAAPTAQAKEATSKAKVEFTTKWQVFTPNSTEAAPVEIEFPNAVNGTEVEGSTLPVKDGAANLTATDFDIIYVTDFDFGTHNYKGNKMDVFAAKPDFTAVESANQTAADNAPLGFSIGSLGNTPVWSLTAKMTPFYKGGVVADANKIAATTIKLHDVVANNVLEDAKKATPKDTELTLTGDGTTSTPIGSFTGGTGMAINNFAFGSVPTGDNEYEGVELNIPAGANIENAEYIATITWTIANTPFA